MSDTEIDYASGCSQESSISMISSEDFMLRQASISELVDMREQALEDQQAYAIHCLIFTAQVVHDNRECMCAIESKRVEELCAKIHKELSLRK